MEQPSAKQLIYVDLAKTQLRELTSTLRLLTLEHQASIIDRLPRRTVHRTEDVDCDG